MFLILSLLLLSLSLLLLLLLLLFQEYSSIHEKTKPPVIFRFIHENPAIKLYLNVSATVSQSITKDSK